MNIYIVSYGRTGGTTFGNWLSKELNKRYIHEPYNPNHLNLYKNLDLSNNNFIIKLEPEQLENVKGDKIIIGLIRENIEECAISHLNAIQTKKYHNPYEISADWIVSNKKEIDELIERITHQNNVIKKMNYDILLTYEGIYETKNDIEAICKFLNIKTTKYLNMMDTKHRYRKYETYKQHLI